MRPVRRAVLPLAIALTACGEPLVVLGDAPGFMRVVVGVGDSIGTRVDSIATRTRLTEPTAIAFDPVGGTLYVADRGSVIQAGGVTRPVARVFAVSSAGRLQLLADRGACAGSVCIERAAGMTLDRGALLIADDVRHRLLRFDISSRALTVLAGDGTRGDSPDGTLASVAKLGGPVDIVVAPDNSVVFSESLNHRVRAIAPDGTLRTLAGTGVPGFSGDGQSALQAQLRDPAGIALHDGTLYVADADNHRLRAISAEGIITTLAGSGFGGFGGDGGPAAAAALSNPRDVSVGAGGVLLFIADQGNDRVRSVNLRTGIITTYAGDGGAFSGPGPAGATALESPSSVLLSESGFLFIADTGHSVVWRTTIDF
jgi:DNA-binding beta-propeller fold protein YncE